MEGFLRAAGEALRGAGPPRIAVLALGAAGAVLMVAAELAPIVSVEVVTASCEDLAQADLRDACVQTGGERHAFALVPLGLLAMAMAWGAGPLRSRPAGAALVLCGLVVLAIALVGDLPDVNETGAIGANFDEAEASPGIGFFFELAAGVLALGAGVLALALKNDYQR